jgi:hypothetical protein
MIKKFNEMNESNNIVSKFDFVDITKHKKVYFLKLNLSSLTYIRDNFSKLVIALKDIEDAGFKSFNTSYTNGYYDSVEDISLEFMGDENIVDISLLIK